MRRLDLLTDDDLPLSLGQLTLCSVRGQGSTGRVFRAESSGVGGLPRIVAVTVLRPGPPTQTGDAWGGKVLAGVHASRTLRHKGIVQTFSAGERDGLPFAVTELVEGVPLPDLVAAAGPLPPRNALDVGIQLAGALGAAHGLAIPLLHLDLRPSRAMVGADGVVKLRGFGLGALAESGGALGSPAFASPEALGGKAPDARSDQFALGAVLAYALLGAPPFEAPAGASSAERVAAIIRAAGAAGLGRRLDGLADGLGAVVGRMVSADPNARYATLTDAEAAMREIRGGLPRGERLGRLVSRHFGRDLGELTVPGPAPPPLLNEELRETRRGPTPAPRPAPPPVADQVPTGSRSTQPLPPPSSVGSPDRPSGAPAPPPVPVPARALVEAPAPPARPAPRPAPPPARPAPPSASPPSPPDEIPTNPGHAEADLESLDVIPSVPSGAPIRTGTVELEPTVPPQRPPPPPPPPASLRPPVAPPADPDRSPTVVPRPSRPAPRPRPAPPQGPTVPLPPPPLSAPLPSPGPSPPRSAPMSARRRKRADPRRGVKILIRVLAVLVILLAGAFIGLHSLLQDPVDEQVPASVEAGPADEPGQVSKEGQAGLVAGKQGEADRADPPAEETTERGSRGVQPVEAVAEPTSPTRASEREAIVSEMAEVHEEPVFIDAPAGSVSLAIDHSPVTGGVSGASDLVSVHIDGPPDTRVVLHSGTAGGPHRTSTLRAKGSGRWEGWLSLDAPSGGTLEYWVVASHPAAERSATSGSAASPHRVDVR